MPATLNFKKKRLISNLPQNEIHAPTGEIKFTPKINICNKLKFSTKYNTAFLSRLFIENRHKQTTKSVKKMNQTKDKPMEENYPFQICRKSGNFYGSSFKSLEQFGHSFKNRIS